MFCVNFGGKKSMVIILTISFSISFNSIDVEVYGKICNFAVVSGKKLYERALTCTRNNANILYNRPRNTLSFLPETLKK